MAASPRRFLACTELGADDALDLGIARVPISEVFADVALEPVPPR